MSFLTRRLPKAHALGLRSLKILAADPLDSSCSAIFSKAGHELTEKVMKEPELQSVISQYDGLVVRSGVKVTREIIEASKGRLKVIGRAGVGVDNIDLKAATDNGILVMNTPGGNTTSAAELTMSLILALARSLPAAVTSLKDGKWERSKYMGTELGGKTLGVVGLGRIGREVAKWCQSFGMTVIGYDPIMSPEVAAEAGIHSVTLDELYARSDYITLHAPKTTETNNLINAATLAKCKVGVRIVNVARGGLVNEADLLAALKSGRVAGAALDVFSKEPPPPRGQGALGAPLCDLHPPPGGLHGRGPGQCRPGHCQPDGGCPGEQGLCGGGQHHHQPLLLLQA